MESDLCRVMPLRLSLRLRVFLGWKEDVANQSVNVYMFSLVVMAASRSRRLAAQIFGLGWGLRRGRVESRD